MTQVSHGKPSAGKPHVRFEEGASAPTNPKRNALPRKKILICGQRSFVGTGLAEKLANEGYDVELFSRGEAAGRTGNEISGDVFSMDQNHFFADVYDVVVNFIIVKNGTVRENLDYAMALHRFCESHNVKRLIQMSSISVYPNSADYVDETSPIETDTNRKGKYAAVKIAVDDVLKTAKRHYELVFARAGYVVSDERTPGIDGIVRPVLPHIGILLGDKRTSLPLVSKKKVHEALLRILRKETPLPAYLLLEGRGGTKADFAKRYWRGCSIALPRRLMLLVFRCLNLLHLCSAHKLELVKGLFKTTYFDPSESEFDLQMSFTDNSVGVIGSGAYGSYAIQRLSETNNPPAISLYEVGDGKIKDETAIGFSSNIVGANYTALQKGRYFGLGGATVKWGGQILLFTHNDFKNPSQFMADIVSLNEKYHDKIFARFGFKDDAPEKIKSYGMFTKTGIWLGYFSRNLFKTFGVAKKKNVRILTNVRVTRLIVSPNDHKTIMGIEYMRRDGKVKHAFHDRYFLCAGAFESNRILMYSGMTNGGSVHFSDQISQAVFDMKRSLVIDGEDYQFGVRGTSLVTKRLVGEIDDVSFFAHPNYNNNFPFFQGLKEIMFQGKRNFKIIWSVLRDLPSVLGFAWSVFVKHKVFVYKGEWNIGIDIENKSEDSNVRLSQKKDDWGLPSLDVDFKVGNCSQHVLEASKNKVRTYLDDADADYTEIEDDIHVEKCEDVYHPYGMAMSDSKDLNDYFTRYPNLLIVNTGVLPRAGGLNTTAACFPLIEEYVERFMR